MDRNTQEMRPEPLGYLIVNGRSEPVFEPIQGFEDLFDETQPKKPYRRRPLRFQDDDETPHTFSIGDFESLKIFYATLLQELNSTSLREVVSLWVQKLEPERSKLYGKYDKYGEDNTETVRPPWWPDIPYIKPAHLQRQHLESLAVDMMLIHRRVDEGKRKNGSWIDQLRVLFESTFTPDKPVRSTASKTSRYYENYREYILDSIAPSLFNTAKLHEDYIARYGLYEGTGNKDPGCGTQISWRPNVLELNGSSRRYKSFFETKVDEQAVRPNSTRASAFGSTGDVKMPPYDNSNHPSPYDVSDHPPPYDVPNHPSPYDVSNHPSPYGTFNHTEDVKMPPYGTSDHTEDVKPPYGISNRPSHYQTPTRIEEGDLQGTGLIPYHSQTVYPWMAGVPYHAYGSNSFAGYSPVVPHNIAAASNNCCYPSCYFICNDFRIDGLPY